MIVNVLGFPATQVPMGLNEEGMPFGFQVMTGINFEFQFSGMFELSENIYFFLGCSGSKSR